MTIYMAESTCFYAADNITLMVTGAAFLQKDFGITYVNLVAKEAERIPPGWVFESATQTDGGWEIKFLYPDDGNLHSQIYTDFFDAESNRLATDGMWWSGGDGGTVEAPVMQDVSYRLKDFAGTEVWLQPNYNDFRYHSEQPVTMEITP